jgi:hypothetical protein
VWSEYDRILIYSIIPYNTCRDLAILINFGDRGKTPPISTALWILRIFQDHYPERLGLAPVINVPFLVSAFFKMLMPLLDPITRQKVKFNPQVLEDGFFTADMIMKDWWGGEPEFEYVHEKYWPHLVSLCEGRVMTWTKNWRALGAKVGTSEWAYKKCIISGSHQDPVELDTDEKDQQVSVKEVSATPIVSAEAQKGVEPAERSKDVKVVTKPSTQLMDFKNGAAAETSDAAHTASHSGPSTTAVSGAGAVAGGGGGGGGGDSGGGGGGDSGGGDSGGGGGGGE